MVKIMENPIFEWMIFRGFPHIFGETLNIMNHSARCFNYDYWLLQLDNPFLGIQKIYISQVPLQKLAGFGTLWHSPFEVPE